MDKIIFDFEFWMMDFELGYSYKIHHLKIIIRFSMLLRTKPFPSPDFH